jgi:hypothetical protein
MGADGVLDRLDWVSDRGPDGGPNGVVDGRIIYFKKKK